MLTLAEVETITERQPTLRLLDGYVALAAKVIEWSATIELAMEIKDDVAAENELIVMVGDILHTAKALIAA
jgi:hypothetical protein